MEDRDGLSEILQAVLAEVGHVRRDQRPRFTREEHLTAVTGRGDPCSLVHVFAYVPLIGHMLGSGVDAHAHLDRTGASAFTKPPRRPAPPKDPPVLGQDIAVSLGAELVKEFGLALDIGEQER